MCFLSQNNQRLNVDLHSYVPDYVNNRMGIVNCANEQYGRIGELGSSTDPLVQAHLGTKDPSSVYNTVRSVMATQSTQIKLRRTPPERFASQGERWR